MLFAGQYVDGESGWAYNRFRFYSPALGVYGAQDPLGVGPNVGSAQGYVTHPGCFIDLLGLEAGGHSISRAEVRRRQEKELLDSINKENAVIAGELPVGHKMNPHMLEISRSQHPETAATFDRAMSQGQPDLLQRTGPDLAKQNRSFATRGWAKNNGSPDEFPYASTAQGGDQATVLGVSDRAQQSQGGMLSRFYATNNVNIGDWFHVRVIE